MTRAEIDSALAALAGLAANPPGDSYLIAALARVVIDQERRLRGLEDAAQSSRMSPEEQAEAARLAAVIVGVVRVKLDRGTPLLPGEDLVAEQIRRIGEAMKGGGHV